METCAECQHEASIVPIPRWKAPLLFVGALLFCPCHLPVSFAIVASLGAGAGSAAWVFGNPTLVYAVFSVLYVVFLLLLYRWFMRSRDRDRHLDAFHQRHAASES